MNRLLSTYQQRMGMKAYSVHEISTCFNRQGLLLVRLEMWQEWVEGCGEGYHLTEFGKIELLEYICWFHSFGFN